MDSVNNGRKPCIAVDFDGVIANYSGWQGVDHFGQPRRDVVSVLHILRDEGWRIIVHTTRSANSILSYLDRNHVPYDEVNCNSLYSNAGSKPVATIYWDDRAFQYTGNAFNDLDAIRKFRTWNGRF